MTALLRRHLTQRCEELLGAFPCLVIQGARQVGKSTLASLLVKQRQATVASLDDHATKDLASEDPLSFVRQRPDGTLVIDEAQRVPDLSLVLKAEIDRDRRPGRFILTGSTNLLANRGVQDSLAGRAVGVRLFGFSQGELNGERDDFVAGAVAGFDDGTLANHSAPESRVEYAGMIARGSFPEATGLSARLRAFWLDSYLERLLHRDALDLSRVRPERLEALLRLLAANQAGELVKARLAEEAGLSASTIGEYLELLRDLYLTDTLPPWTPNLTSREIGRHKGVIIDSGLAARLRRATEQGLASLAGNSSFGALLEGFVAAELLKQRGWSEFDYSIYHYRDRNGLEVDLVLELADNSFIAIEVKASASYSARQFTNLKALREKLGKRFAAGFVLTTAQTAYPFSHRLWGLPVAALWRL